KLESLPNVEDKKVKVVKNIPAASRLPIADTLGQAGRSAMHSPIAISITPKAIENVLMELTLQSQLISGPFAMSGFMLSPSHGMNFIAPAHRSKITVPYRASE